MVGGVVVSVGSVRLVCAVGCLIVLFVLHVVLPFLRLNCGKGALVSVLGTTVGVGGGWTVEWPLGVDLSRRISWDFLGHFGSLWLVRRSLLVDGGLVVALLAGLGLNARRLVRHTLFVSIVPSSSTFEEWLRDSSCVWRWLCLS